MSNESARTPRRELQVGDVVDGRYELRRELGRGAGGVVFEALHRFTERSTALKAVSGEVSPALLSEYGARLTREGRALTSVRHAGVVDVLDGGVLDDGTPFLVLEKLDGRTLEGLLAVRGTLSPEDSVAIGLQLCDSLDAMHRVGVVHRDIKPSNIFVVRDRDGVERLKLLDFGIAVIKRPDQEKLTAAGMTLGTPAYMSPEQLLGLDVDQRTDIYSLGVTLFQCLSGRVPHDGTFPAMVLNVCGPDAKATLLGDVAPGLAPELSSVVDRAIAFDRDHRFASAVELGRALQSALPAPRTKTFFLGPPPMPKFEPTTAPAEPPPEQRRVAPRAPYVTPAQITVGGVAIDGRTEDISEGGVLFICRSTCESGGVATIRFGLPIEGKVTTCQARVRWVRAARPSDHDGPRAVGLEFVELPDAVRASIGRYVGLMGSDGR